MKKFHFVVLALAVWRLSTMLVKEDGPWMMLEHLRLKMGLQPPQHPAMGRETDPPGQMPGSILNCVWCTSIYIGSFFTLLFAFNRRIALWAATPFALSAVSCMIDRWDGWSDR